MLLNIHKGQEHATIFCRNIVSDWQPWQITNGKKAFARENLNCYTSRTKGLRKLKVGKISLQIFQIFLRKN